MGSFQKFVSAFVFIGFGAAAYAAPTSVMQTEDQMIDAAFADALARGSEAALDQNLRIVARTLASQDSVATANNPSLVNELYRGILEKVDAEHWTQFETHHFSIVKSLFRSQGLTTDNKGNWWFSSRSSLLRTTSKTGSEHVFKLFPLPKELVALKDNHIGDIDYADGKIYAPVEDGSKYLHPYIVVYDAHKLTVDHFVSVPHDLQPDGVPWVAVDAANQRVYSSQYSNTTKINVYDMATLKPLGQIAMSRMINSIQGGKVLNGSLYMTADSEDGKSHSIYKMNLTTGMVLTVAQMPKDLVEVEGLSFAQTAKGLELNALGVVVIKNPISKKIRRTEICGFHLDQMSRRDQFRQTLLNMAEY